MLTAIFTSVCTAIHVVMPDATLIKGHEFPLNDSYAVLIDQGVTKTVEFAASAEILGLLIAMAMGSISTVSGPPVVHTITALNAATSDQLPSISMVEATSGDTASYLKLKGVVLNDLMISATSKGRFSVKATFITDGSLTAKTGFSIPTTEETVNPMAGRNILFKFCDSGGSLVDNSALVRSVEWGWSNNVDMADSRGQIASGTPYLTNTRFGNRKMTVKVKLWGSKGDAIWTDWIAGTLKYLEISFVAGATSVVITILRAKIISCKDGFDGIRNVLELEYEGYSSTTTTFTPATVVVTNLVAGYLT